MVPILLSYHAFLKAHCWRSHIFSHILKWITADRDAWGWTLGWVVEAQQACFWPNADCLISDCWNGKLTFPRRHADVGKPLWARLPSAVLFASKVSLTVAVYFEGYVSMYGACLARQFRFSGSYQQTFLSSREEEGSYVGDR